MSRMQKGREEHPERARPDEARSRRKRRVLAASPEPFARAFADALRDILREELRLTS